MDDLEKISSRLPPGQRHVQQLPVLHEGRIPRADLDTWSLRIFGEVKEDVVLDYEKIRAMPVKAIFCDIHCVTGWTMLNTAWEGVSTKMVLTEAEVLPRANYIMVHGENGYSTNMPLEVFLRDTNVFAYHYAGEELPPQYGWPLRLIVPSLYLWKSAKWVTGLELMRRNRPGYWESKGYHLNGDPWKEERYS